MKTFGFIADCNEISSKSGETFQSVSPGNGRVWAELAECAEADVYLAVEAASKCQKTVWGCMSPTEVLLNCGFT